MALKYFILAFFTLLLHVSATAQYDPKALEILDAMSKKYMAIPSFEADISYKILNESEKINDVIKGKIIVKGNKYFLNLNEQQVFNNGIKVWTYLPEEKEVNVNSVDSNSDDVIDPSKIFHIYKKGYKYLFLGEVTEGGVLCEEVDLVPEKKDTKYFKIRMMISKKDKSVRNFTFFEKSGNRYRYEIANFVANNKIEDSFFTFDPKKHPGVEVIE